MESPPDIKIDVFGKTDVGLIREHNEDNFVIADVSTGLKTNQLEATLQMKLGAKGNLLLVCDGMGGAAAGEVASQMAVDTIVSILSDSGPLPRDAFARLLRRAIEEANDRIFAQSRDNQNERGMGTTCTAAALVDNVLVVGQIGDSRCYVIRNGALAQVTKDQSLAWQLIEVGALAPEDVKEFEHANIILQALGVQEHVDVVLSQVELRQGDIVLVCSDGLHGPVSDAEMLEIVKAEPDLQKATDALVKKALDRDGPDNVTVVLGRFGGGALPAPQPTDVLKFVAYDPGTDPDAKPRPPVKRKTTETTTIQERVPDEIKNLPPLESDGPLPPMRPTWRERLRRSMFTILFFALVAATVSGILLTRCQSDPQRQSDVSGNH